MTAQIAECLFYEGTAHAMYATPLSSYLAEHADSPKFAQHCTALWRGYVGTWEIQNDRLYLIDLQGTLTDGTQVKLATIFPDEQGKIFASWFSGKIRIPQGALLDYIHMGFHSTYEMDIFLSFEQGLLVDKQVQKNTPSQ